MSKKQIETTEKETTKPLQSRIPVDVHIGLNVAAARRGKPKESLVTEILKEWLAKNEQQLAGAGR